MLEFDIWDNLTYFKNDDGVWFKQTFFEDELLKYEDSKGNYWAKEFGDFPYKRVVLSLDSFSNPNSTNYLIYIKYGDFEVEICANTFLKGTTSMDAGYVYAPYVPLVMEPTITSDRVTALGMALLASNYEKKTVNSNMEPIIQMNP